MFIILVEFSSCREDQRVIMLLSHLTSPAVSSPKPLGGSWVHEAPFIWDISEGTTMIWSQAKIFLWLKMVTADQTSVHKVPFLLLLYILFQSCPLALKYISFLQKSDFHSIMESVIKLTPTLNMILSNVSFPVYLAAEHTLKPLSQQRLYHQSKDVDLK